MKIIVAPDSYKGSMSASDVAKHMQIGIKRVYPDAEIILFPMADGGEGTLEVMVANSGGELCTTKVQGPLGSIVDATWGYISEQQTGIIEIAQASGISLVPKDKLNPLKASTFGVGELIIKALDKGCTRLIITLGGSATNDGGAGMVAALGAKLLDKDGEELEPGGASLKHLSRIDISNLDPRLSHTEVICASDVVNPLCGKNGSSVVFGPQKGATDEMVKELDAALARYANKIKESIRKDVSDIPGSGAAGGLGAGLIAFLNATIQSGSQIIMDFLQFDSELHNADLIITGEGKTDKQTSYGKAPMAIALRGKKYNIPVLCISGSIEDHEEIKDIGIDAFFSIINKPSQLDDVMKQTGQLIELTVENILKVYRIRNIHK
jgi:glycerate kinase